MSVQRTKEVIEVDGHEVALSNTAKVLFPHAGLTKGELIGYYRRIAPTMLPHLVGRPLSFERFPDGIDASGFMQKNASDYFPGWIRRARAFHADGHEVVVLSRSGEGAGVVRWDGRSRGPGAAPIDGAAAVG